MTKDEALKLAKELDGVIADVEEGDGFDDVCLDTVKYVRDALLMAQPNQHQDWCASLTQMLASMPPKPAPCNCKPEPVIDKSAAVRIATALGWEPKRKPLTDEELRAIENKINPNMRWRSSDEEGITLYPIEYYELVRAIEAAHGIFEDKK